MHWATEGSILCFGAVQVESLETAILQVVIAAATGGTRCKVKIAHSICPILHVQSDAPWPVVRPGCSQRQMSCWPAISIREPRCQFCSSVAKLRNRWSFTGNRTESTFCGLVGSTGRISPAFINRGLDEQWSKLVAEIRRDHHRKHVFMPDFEAIIEGKRARKVKA